MDTQNLAKWISELQAQIDQVKRIAQAAGGDTVTITPALESGTKVADYAIGEDTGSLYAPAAYVPPDYDDAEFDTGRKWIDGRTVYGIVVTDSISAAVTSKVIHTNTDIDMIIFISGIIKGDDWELSIPYNTSTTDAYVNFKRTDGTLLRTQSSNMVSDYPDCLVYMEYVKTPPSPEPENNTKAKNRRN